MAIMIMLKKRKRNESMVVCVRVVVRWSGLSGERGDRVGNARRSWDLRVDDVLKMNFSVGVNMYSENVTWSKMH